MCMTQRPDGRGVTATGISLRLRADDMAADERPVALVSPAAGSSAVWTDARRPDAAPVSRADFLADGIGLLRERDKVREADGFSECRFKNSGLVWVK